MTAATHPDALTLAAFGLGRLKGEDRAAIEAHVAECVDCCQALEGVQADSLVDLARAAMATNPIAGVETLPPGIPPALVDHPRYKVLKRIGAGGMGAVYLAEHRIMGRTVALKVIAPGLVADPAALDRFRREVRLASRLSHPNIVTAYDADEAEGQHFFVMEFVEGVSLHRLVAKKGPLPAATACHLVRQAAMGLQHAFEKGMVHRDIKPHNLMVTKKGQVKILDFGLARIADPSDAAGTTRAGGVTAPDVVLGTPDFLAPEQARNSASADIRADLYALGCTLYYLLTGKPPFKGDTAMAKLIAHIEDEPEPISASRSDVSAGLVEVLAKLMAKDPAKRPQTPADAAALLAPFTRPGGPEPVEPEVVEAVLSLDPPTPEEAVKPTLMLNRTTPGRRKRRSGKRGSKRRMWQLGVTGAALVFVAIGLVIASRSTRKPEISKGSNEPTANASPALAARKSPRVVMVLASFAFWNPDYEPVRKALEAEGCRVSTAAAKDTARPDPGGGGLPVKVDYLLSNLKADDWDAVVFVGGSGVAEWWNPRVNEAAITPFVNEMLAKKRVVSAICMAPAVLAHAHFLAGRRATMRDDDQMSREMRNKLREVNWENRDVVIDGPFVTGRNAAAGQSFALTVVAEIRKKSTP